MNAEEHELTIRRILVALDASGHSLAALKAAVELAASLKAELLGLFVEDINLLRLAGLPFAQEIPYPLAAAQQMDSLRLEQELRTQASRARRALAEAAEPVRVSWSFRVARGQVTAEVLTAASEVDLLSLGIASRPLIRRTRPGSTALTVAARAPRTVLLLQQGEKIRPPVLVTYDGSVSAKRALAIAARLIQTLKPNGSRALIVLTVANANAPELAQRLEQEAETWLLGQDFQLSFRRLSKADVPGLVQAVRAEQAGLLVLGGEMLLLEAETIQALLDKISCPVLLVR
jgi:nucleotide-binding universal stress UspA family protein